MLRRINKFPCRNSLSPLAETEAEGSRVRYVASRFGSVHGAPSHKKYVSCVGSLGESPLCVRQEQLRAKEKEQGCVVAREPRVKRKQKTEHVNYKYLEWMRLRRQGISWIEYNMTLGVAFLWKKVQAQIAHFQNTKKIKYNHRFELQVDSISREINNIIQEATLNTPNAHTDDFSKLFQGRDSAQFKSLAINLAEAEKKISSKHFQSFYKSRELLKKGKNKMSENAGSSGAATPNNSASLSQLKESVCKLNSYFCLFQRRVSLRKEDRLISEFVERRSSNISFSPQELQELEQIMRINQERCQLMSEIISNVGILRSQESSLHASQKILKKIGEIDLIRELAITSQLNREEVLKTKMKSCNNIIIEIAQTQHQPQTTTEENNIPQESIFNEPPSNYDFPKNKKHKPFQRSSIESIVPPFKENYTNVPSKINLIWKEKNNSKSNKLVRDEKPKKTEKQKQALLTKKVSLKKQSKQDGEKEKQKRPQKRVIGFAVVQEQQKALTDHKSVKTKLKSAKSIKSRKQITWDDIEKKEYRSLKSVKSLKSLKSLKSINSYSELGSRKFLRSLKTQREMKYLHGHIRDISYISKYRDKLFKLNGLEDENPNQLRDFIDVTSERKQSSSNHSVNTQDQIDCRSNHSIEIPFQNYSPQSNVESFKSISIVTEKKSEKNERVSLQNEELVEQPSQKEGFIRDFLKRFGLIEKENSITKQKCLILIELQNMLDNKVITIQMFERYRGYFEGERKSTADYRQTEKFQTQTGTKQPSHYAHLLNFRKLIQNTTQLNQINKYYYNISQFKGEEEQINKTKQANKREDFFFHIRSSTEQQKKNRAVENNCREGKEQWRPKVLYQKGI